MSTWTPEGLSLLSETYAEAQAATIRITPAR
jgi:hypothetical protein